MVPQQRINLRYFLFDSTSFIQKILRYSIYDTITQLQFVKRKKDKICMKKKGG
jgi:hypothetical protein